MRSLHAIALVERTEEHRQSLVGQFFCGRIIPNLLSSLALTLSGILLPYMSADWEHRDFDNIRKRMRVMLLMVSVGFMGISVVGMICSPWLFEYFLRNRYAEAESIMPMSLVQCTWSGLSLIAGAYLLCAEKARQGNYVLGVGLVANVGLNAVLIEPWGSTDDDIHDGFDGYRIGTDLLANSRRGLCAALAYLSGSATADRAVTWGYSQLHDAHRSCFPGRPHQLVDQRRGSQFVGCYASS